MTELATCKFQGSRESQLPSPSTGVGRGQDCARHTFVSAAERFEIQNRERASEALERILSTGLLSFYRIAYRVLGNIADAEDALQDALLAAYTHLDQFKGQARMSSWLTSIVLNSARMQLRRRRRYVQVPLDEPSGESRTLSVSERLRDGGLSPEDEYRNSELKVRLTHLHLRLSPALGRTFQLRDIEGLSIRETARILRVPCGTVKARSARARKKIKEFMHQAVRRRSSSLPGHLLGFANPARSSALAQ